MANVSGRVGTLEVSSDGGSNYSTVGEVTDISPSWSHDTEDATTFTSAGYKESDYGETQLALNASWLYDAADAGQDKVRASNEAKTKILYRYKPAGSGDTYLFTGKIDSLDYSSKRNERVAQTVKVVSSGTITVS